MRQETGRRKERQKNKGKRINGGKEKRKKGQAKRKKGRKDR